MEFLADWWGYLVPGYFGISFLLLLMNRRWRWVYGWVFKGIDSITPPLEDPIDTRNLKNDPGLVFVLVILGPVLIVITGLIAVAGCISSGLFVIFPRWIINSVIGKPICAKK